MPYTLSLRDSRQAGECARILATPSEFAGFDEWSSAVSERLTNLLGADKATFAISEGSELHDRAEVFTQAALREYIQRYLVHDKFGLLTRQLAFGAFSRRIVWGERRNEILRSSYWNELVRPARAFDTIGLSATLKTAGIANLQFYHDQEGGPKFGARGLAILRAVYPAFATGCRSWVALHKFSRQLASVVDTMPVGVILARLDGSVFHVNADLRGILASVAPENSLMCAITECIDRFRRIWSDRAPVMTSAPPRPTAGDHRISGHTYRLSVSFLGGDVLPGGGAIVVVVEPIGPRPFPGGLLRQRYNLTGRETEVARLLAEGKTNLEVAAALGVSAPTARHHTESVMLKLGVNARGKVAAKLGALTSGDR